MTLTERTELKELVERWRNLSSSNKTTLKTYAIIMDEAQGNPPENVRVEKSVEDKRVMREVKCNE